MSEVKRTVTIHAQWVDASTRWLERWLLMANNCDIAWVSKLPAQREYQWDFGGLSKRTPAPTLDEAMQAAERALGAEVAEGGAK